MKWTLGTAAMLLMAAAGSARADDVDNIYKMGEAAKRSGLAVDYSVSGWSRNLDLNIGSMLPGDARNVANGVCQFAREKMAWQQSWTVRVFLVVGDRPAATCATR